MLSVSVEYSRSLEYFNRDCSNNHGENMNAEPPVSSTAHPAAAPQATGLRFLIRALRHRNYRLFFIGQSISLIGTWMTRIATSWLVYRLTNSALLLGLVGFVGQLPSFLLAPFAGVLVDRWNRHRLLVVTQVSAMGQSLALAFLALTGLITITQFSS
jgi:hypothetical protein